MGSVLLLSSAPPNFNRKILLKKKYDIYPNITNRKLSIVITGDFQGYLVIPNLFGGGRSLIFFWREKKKSYFKTKSECQPITPDLYPCVPPSLSTPLPFPKPYSLKSIDPPLMLTITKAITRLQRSYYRSKHDLC